MRTQLLRYLRGGVVEDEIRRIVRDERAEAPLPSLDEARVRAIIVNWAAEVAAAKKKKEK